MAVLESGTKVSVVIEYIERTGTVVSSAQYGPEGLKYTVELDEAIPYGWNLKPTTEFIIEQKLVRGI
jgi:hypothetical protein